MFYSTIKVFREINIEGQVYFEHFCTTEENEVREGIHIKPSELLDAESHWQLVHGGL